MWGRNIFDKSYDLTRNFFLPSSEVAAAGEPTTVGIRLDLQVLGTPSKPCAKFSASFWRFSSLVLIGAWLKLRGPDIPFETLEAKYAEADSHFVDLPGGYHAHYREDGDPNLPLLVLLHGFADSFTTWDGWVRELKPQFHIISLDFPGHGLTRAPAGSSH